MKFIPLRNSTQAVVVDDEDYELTISKGEWQLRTTPTSQCIQSCQTFPTNRGYYVPLVLARLLLNVTDSHIQVDHIDGNIFDCRRHNMRTASKSQNMCNRGKQKNNTQDSKVFG
jgi:hypothetical protein